MLALHVNDALAVVEPEHGGRLARLAVDDVDLLTDRGSFVMAPWAGRTGFGRFAYGGQWHSLPTTHGPHAIHGTVRHQAWTVEDADEQRARLTCELGPDWPWPGWAEQEVVLGEHHLELTLAVYAAGPTFPAACGWHPWFRRSLDAGPELQVALDAGAMLERGVDHLPTGRRVEPPPPNTRRFDDCFVDVRWPVVLTWPGTLRLEVHAGCPAVVLYDEPDDAVCVEPQTAPPDALRRGEGTEVTADRPLLATTLWRWSPTG